MFVGVLTFLFVFNARVGTQVPDASPCPRLFVYEGKSNEPNKWYGLVTLLSDSDLKGIWLRLVFDSPSLQIGNWFGEANTSDHKEYLIKNRNFELKAHTPHVVRFYLKYDPARPPPRLVSFRQNAKTVCPEPLAVQAPVSMEYTSGNGENTVAQPPKLNLTPGKVPGPTGVDDEILRYPDGFDQYFRPTGRPALANNKEGDSICGTVVVQPQALIAHGLPTFEGEFPWHTALYHSKGIDLAYICGGSLISKYHVITAAHCITRRRTQTPLNVDNLVVYLGKHYLKRFSSTGIQDRQVSEIIPHPGYNPQVFTNDIALIRLEQAAEFTDYVRPICLWQDSTELNSVLEKEGTVVGWGLDESGKLTEQLMQAKMPVVSPETCIYSYPEFYSRFTSPTTFCAGFRNGTSVCNGDSGGGMVFPKQNPFTKKIKWQLRGLVSLSVPLQNQARCDTSYYVIFTDSAKYLDWIQKTIAKK